MKFTHTLYILIAMNLLMASCKLAPIRIRQHRGDKVLAIKPLSKNINSTAEELSPVISRDGNTLFFVRGHHPENVGGIAAGQDVWVAKRDPNTQEWLPAVNLGAPINNIHHNVVCGTNRDGTVIYLTQQYLKDGTMESGISKSVWKDGKWSFPEPIEVNGIKNLSGHFHFYMDPRGQFLIISMRPGGKQSVFEEDLYVFFWDRKRKCFRKKRRLPSIINSPNVYETAPFLSADRKRLYFTRYDQQANAHIYVTQRNDVNNWKRWSEPLEVYQALGESAFHSEHFEAYFVLHNNKDEIDDYGFFATARPGVLQANTEKGQPYKADIFEFKIKRQYTIVIETRDKKTRKPLPTQVVLRDAQGNTITPSKTAKQTQHVFSKLSIQQARKAIFTAQASTQDSLYIDAQQGGIKFGGVNLYKIKKVIYLDPNPRPYTLMVETRDAQTKKLLPTQLRVKDKNGQTLSSSTPNAMNQPTYKYSLRLADIRDNMFAAKATTNNALYLPATENNLRFASEKQMVLKKTLYLQPQKNTETMPQLSFTINFDFDSARIRPLEAKLLEFTASFIQQNQLRFALHGHTDAVGHEHKNDTLAQQRVEATLQYLLGKSPDIQQKLSRRQAFGEQKLLIATPHREERNRRVEITIYGVANEQAKQAFLEKLREVRKKWEGR
ncbi:hypothetical protein BKI52_38460 [marine bacterium AO1-C]|nr:hypothetical protein BKI52_38460 [marine bacterium AO1-C]